MVLRMFKVKIVLLIMIFGVFIITGCNDYDAYHLYLR